MPDSITHVEMDDVLSSIRRLVSEETSKKTAPVARENDRFVLTPAHRVAEGETAGDDVAGPDAASASDLPDILSAAATNQTVEKPKTWDAAPAEPEVASPEFEAMEQAWKSELARVAAVREDASDDTEPGASKSDAAQPSLELRIAELEEAVGQADDDWEPDGSEPEASQPLRRHIFEVVDNTKSDDPDLPDTSEDEPDTKAPVFAHSDTPHPKPYLLSDTDQPTEPEAETAPLQQTEVAEFSSTRKAEIADDDDVFLDVEALRSMIADVVREELRGKLGESITRNVRRMLQEEISRAITQQLSDDS